MPKLTEAEIAEIAARILDIMDRSVPKAPKAAQHTWATKAERAAGGGFTCTCGRTGLRVEPHPARNGKPASMHKAPDGTTHTIA